MRKIFIIAVALATLFTFIRSYFWLTDGFSINNIASEFAYRENLALTNPSPLELQRINNVLQQKFYYLGKGAQAYAFESEDGQYVLKLVKQKHYKFSLLEEIAFRFSAFEALKEKKKEKVQRRVQNFLSSALLCYQELRDETALFYLHLTPTDHLHHTVYICDKLGMRHEIDLDHSEFMLQSKADLLTTKISTLMKNSDIEGVKSALQQMIFLINSCWQKGITDRDTHTIKNIGFVGDKAIYIDVGEFFKNPRISEPEFSREYIEECFHSFDVWLADHYPELKGYVDELKSNAVVSLKATSLTRTSYIR